MGKRCCVDGCQSNKNKSRAQKNLELKERNDENNADLRNVSTFGFPKEPDECQRWIAAIPYYTEAKHQSYKCPPRVCEKHWPDGYEKAKNVNGRERPQHPPSIFSGVPSSSVPTPPPKPRPTTKSSNSARTTKQQIALWYPPHSCCYMSTCV